MLVHYGWRVNIGAFQGKSLKKALREMRKGETFLSVKGATFAKAQS